MAPAPFLPSVVWLSMVLGSWSWGDVYGGWNGEGSGGSGKYMWSTASLAKVDTCKEYHQGGERSPGIVGCVHGAWLPGELAISTLSYLPSE